MRSFNPRSGSFLMQRYWTLCAGYDAGRYVRLTVYFFLIRLFSVGAGRKPLLFSLTRRHRQTWEEMAG